MNLKYLTDKQLAIDTQKLVTLERKTTAEILWHLKEIDERRLYVDYKCTSLFDYCVRILKYSEGSAARRVSAARLLKSMPEIMPKIESGALSLTNLNLVQRIAKNLDNIKKQELLIAVENKSSREAEVEVNKNLGLEQKPMQKLLITEEVANKLEILKNKLSNKFEDINNVLEFALDAALAKLKTPAEKIEPKSKNPRYIPAKLKSYIHMRDNGKCQNCGSQHRLNIDHIKPIARGGMSNSENLRLLCFNCNQRERIRKMGRSLL